MLTQVYVESYFGYFSLFFLVMFFEGVWERSETYFNDNLELKIN